MDTTLVITFTGSDRVGIVDALAQIVASHGANWEESRMASLAGRFAGILKVRVAAATADALVAALSAAEGLSVIIDRGHGEAPSGRHLKVELLGADRPGIVRDVAQVFVAHGFNIEELDSEHVEAPMSGGLLFKATAELSAQADSSIDALVEALDGISDELMVDLQVEAMS